MTMKDRDGNPSRQGLINILVQRYPHFSPRRIKQLSRRHLEQIYAAPRRTKCGVCKGPLDLDGLRRGACGGCRE